MRGLRSMPNVEACSAATSFRFETQNNDNDNDNYPLSRVTHARATKQIEQRGLIRTRRMNLSLFPSRTVNVAFGQCEQTRDTLVPGQKFQRRVD